MKFDLDARYIITVVGDVNDDDAITKRTTLNGYETAQVIVLFKRVSKGSRVEWNPNWDTSEHRRGPSPQEMHGLTEEEFEMLDGLMPSFDCMMIHTLESVTVAPEAVPLWTWNGKEA